MWGVICIRMCTSKHKENSKKLSLSNGACNVWACFRFWFLWSLVLWICLLLLCVFSEVCGTKIGCASNAVKKCDQKKICLCSSQNAIAVYSALSKAIYLSTLSYILYSYFCIYLFLQYFCMYSWNTVFYSGRKLGYI